MHRFFNILAAIIIVSAVILAISSVWNDSPIVDEIPHIGAGYSYVIKGDYRLNPEHPPLAKDLAGLSLLFLNLNQDIFNTSFWNQEINDQQWNFGRQLIFNFGNDTVKLIRAAKLPMLLFFILSAIIIFLWTKKLYGAKAALLGLFLFVFSPTVIAHSRFVATDIPALFGVLFATYFFIKFLKTSSKKNFLLAVLAFGIAQLTKFSAFLLVPFFGVLSVSWALTQKEKIINIARYIFLTGAVIASGYILIVWPVYALHTRNYPIELQKRDTKYHLASYGNRTAADPVVWASGQSFIRPLAQYGLGLLMVTQRSVGGNTAYFLGEVKNVAWKKYFPVVYFIKEPLPFWILTLAVLVFLSLQIRKKPSFTSVSGWLKNHFTEFAMLLWLAIYWYSSIKANLNIGVRHLLPTYGFVYILVAGQLSKIIQNAIRQLADKYQNHNSKFKIFNLNVSFFILIFTFSILLGWYLAENLRVYPYYLTYFNQIAGGPSGGYRYVVDSNLDWGQDLKRLADWVEENDIPKINLDYFGWADPYYYLKEKYVWMAAGKYKSAEDFLKEYPDGGYIAVSASFLMGTSKQPIENYLWLNSYKPLTVIGNSIFVWHITK